MLLSQIQFSIAMEMFGLRHAGVLILLLVSYLSPATACMMPGAQLNVQERACCRAMMGQCGGANMPVSRSCCQNTRASVHSALLSTEEYAIGSDTAALQVSAITPMEPTGSLPDASSTPVELIGSSLPQSPPGSISVLRI